MLYIQNVSGLTIRDLHLTRQSPGATQGFVNRVDDKEVILGKLFYPKLFKKISYDCKQIWNLLQFRVIFIILKLDICSFVSLLFIYSSRVSYIYILDIPPGFSLYILFRYPSRVSSIYIYFLDIPPGFPLYL